jgi:hypothetical protein
MQNVEDYAGSAGTEPHAWETGLMDTITYVGLDVDKATVSVAVAESGRDGEIRQIGVFENRPEVLAKLAARLAKGGRRLSFCYEAGPCESWAAPLAMGAHSGSTPSSEHKNQDFSKINTFIVTSSTKVSAKARTVSSLH